MWKPYLPRGLRALIIRYWPEQRLRTLIFNALLLAAILPMLGTLLVLRPPPVLLDSLWQERNGLAIAGMIVFILLMLLSAMLARTIVGPVERLSEASRGLAAGQGAGDVPESPSLKVTEIELLYADFRSMEAAISRRSRYLRDFAASVSHEFKTPLAGIIGAIELLEDHGASMTEVERATFLGNMEADSARLSRLVGRMMALAKADMQTASDEAGCDATPVLRRVADGLARDSFAVQLDLPERLPLAISAEALAAIATILIENSAQAGAARVTISAQPHALVVQDNGPGIPLADAGRIFEPFFTAKRAAGGTGLGLAIARSLAQAHGGTLRLEDGTGACFRLCLSSSPRLA